MARLSVKSLGVPTLVGLALLSLVLCPFGMGAQRRPNTPACDVRVDLQYELRPGKAVRSATGEVAPPVVRLIMSRAGEVDWDELTKHGRKYQGICRDDEHPYYVLVWEVADWGAEAGLYVLDNGCLVVPSVSGTVSIITNGDQRDKAIKKVFEAALCFLAEKGKQPAPSPLACVPPEWIGPTKYKLTKGNAAVSAQAGQSPAVEPAAHEGRVFVGTGFFVSEHGHVLTNAHVVSGCKQIQTRDGRAANLVNKDEQLDLALLKIEGESPAVATFRGRPAPRAGDSVVAFGFPLQGILSSEGNLTTGTIAATSGIGDDPRFLQISVPVQPGNSGSPLLDSSGDVIGVVEAKLDAVETLRIAGDIPQNVNFAIQGSEAIRFLERNHIGYHAQSTEAVLDLKVADVAARAKQFSAPIECLR
jgi:S1-C subfamily serine protease